MGSTVACEISAFQLYINVAQVFPLGLHEGDSQHLVRDFKLTTRVYYILFPLGGNTVDLHLSLIAEIPAYKRGQ